MPTALFSSATLAEVYRFALLLTGDLDAAGEAVAGCLHSAETQLAEIRSEPNRRAVLIQSVRDRCQRLDTACGPPTPRLVRTAPEAGGKREILEIEAFIVARRFATLPEPARSALALFYLELFGPEEIARVLKMSPEELGGVLGEGRELLAGAMEVSAG